MKYIISQITKNFISIQGNTPMPQYLLYWLKLVFIIILVNNHQAKVLFFFTLVFFFFTLSLNLPRSLWFNLGTPRIILLRSSALRSEQAILASLLGSCCVFRGNFWEQSTTGGNSSIGNFVPFFFPLFCFYFIVHSLLHEHLGQKQERQIINF